MGVCTKERKGGTAEVLMATPCTKLSHWEVEVGATSTWEIASIFFLLEERIEFLPPSTQHPRREGRATRRSSAKRARGREGACDTSSFRPDSWWCVCIHSVFKASCWSLRKD